MAASNLNLLMLSHCLPETQGDAQRARAWQLLRLASQSHQVHLACRRDAPVNLVQWRAVQALARQISLEDPAWGKRLAAPGVRLLDEPAADRMLLTDALGPVVQRWTSQMAWDAIVCTHAGLWPLAAALPARLRVCDLHRTSRTRLRQADPSCRPMGRWRRNRQLRLHEHLEHDIARHCEVVTIDRPSDVLRFARHARKTVVLPEAVDGFIEQTGQSLLSALRPPAPAGEPALSRAA